MKHSLLFSAFLVFAFLATSLPAAVVYTVTPITSTNASLGGISNNGNAAGLTNSGTALRYTGVLQNLGQGPSGVSTAGNAINDSGWVVGAEQGFGFRNALLYNGTAWVNLTPLVGVNSDASDINSSGMIVGRGGTASLGAYLLQGSTVTTLGMSNAVGINDAGVIVGWRPGGTGDMAVIRSVAGILTDLGTLTGFASRAYGISETGDFVAGAFFANGSSGTLTNALLYSPSTGTISLGTLGGSFSEARSVNSSGVAVGTSTLATNQNRAFVYDGVNGMRDLNTLISPTAGMTLLQAMAINDAGQILALGSNASGTRGVLLTPVSAVPEPGTLMLGACGLVLVVVRRRRGGHGFGSAV